MILKREVLVEGITDDAAKKVIRSRGEPITEVENIIEYKHNGGTYYGIYHSHDDKFYERFVSEQFYTIP
jgi:hypothetical protein